MEIREILGRFREGLEVTVRGRVISIRPHGKTCFSHVKDGTGRIQVYGRSDRLENFGQFTKLTLGDIIEGEGSAFFTKTGEKTVLLSKFTLLTKPKKPLPKEWYGVRDTEIRYRQRYLDLLVNPEVKERFIKRSRTVSVLRNLLDERGFIEVETPMLHSEALGAEAEPFLTHHNALNSDLYLRIAPELYLKRLIVGGFDKVYEIGKSFRNEGISTIHNPEFTMVEIYLAYSDYNDMMDLASWLISETAEKILGSKKIAYQGRDIDLSPPWRKIPVFSALSEAVSEKIESLRDAENFAKKQKIEVENPFNTLIDKFVQPNLIEPTFLIDFPAELSPLAKRKKDNPNLAERFEIIVGGQELGNAYSELTDPDEQLKNFEAQGRIDQDYIEALRYGMPPTGGLGIGIDRLCMVFCDQTSIRELILFPQLKPKDVEGDIR
jgi:lysyl-tRNA synthetase class 2